MATSSRNSRLKCICDTCRIPFRVAWRSLRVHTCIRHVLTIVHQASGESACGQGRAGVAGRAMQLAMIGIYLAVAGTDRSMPPRASANADADGDDRLAIIGGGNLALSPSAAIFLQARIAVVWKRARKYRMWCAISREIYVCCMHIHISRAKPLKAPVSLVLYVYMYIRGKRVRLMGRKSYARADSIGSPRARYTIESPIIPR